MNTREIDQLIKEQHLDARPESEALTELEHRGLLHPCGHTHVWRGCGGCDPSAIEEVVETVTIRGVKCLVHRPFDPDRDLDSSKMRPHEEAP